MYWIGVWGLGAKGFRSHDLHSGFTCRDCLFVTFTWLRVVECVVQKGLKFSASLNTGSSLVGLRIHLEI